ncbi:unnamed protein product [Arabis nemorensis]|uniref:Uncharacterized protein n=1 Tax=Arabis nemorensis TaxID=586526 RepID=A0A565CRS5_9BRAS|nr:unnamed protein product [Arabis nemorensis]
MRLKLPRYEALRLPVSHLLLRCEVLSSRAEMDKEVKEFVGNHRYCEPLNCFSLVETSRFIVDIKLLSFGIFPFFDVSCTKVVVYFKVLIHHLSYVVLDSHCDVYSFMECLVLSKSLFEGWKMLELGGIHNQIPSGSFVSHLSPCSHYIVSALLAEKLTLLEAGDVLFGSLNRLSLLISKEVATVAFFMSLEV